MRRSTIAVLLTLIAVSFALAGIPALAAPSAPAQSFSRAQKADALAKSAEIQPPPEGGAILRAGGPDGYGYIYKDEAESGGPGYGWIDTLGATYSGLTGDDATMPLTIPFTFTYYGTGYTTLNICTNGFAAFNASGTSWSNATLPSASIPAATLCPFWDDLNVDGSTARIHYKTTGSSPTRSFAVIWSNIPDLSATFRVTFEIILKETENSIFFQYHDPMTDLGTGATVGIQGAQTGLNFLLYELNGSYPLANTRAIKFWIQQLDHDVGVTSITAPTASFTPGTPVTPACVVKNWGLNSESNFPVTCWIDSAGTRIYNQTTTVAGPLAPNATTAVTFSPNWTPGNALNYAVTMFTNLSTDLYRNNDTARMTTTNANFVWSPFTPNPNATDRIVHATVYDPVGDKFYMIGGNPAGASGTYVTNCDRYDPAANTWAAMAPKPTATGWSPGSYCRGKIYYIAGHTNSGTVQTNTEIYDIGGNTWATGPSGRPNAITCPVGQVTWRDTLIYCLGGTNLTNGYTNVDIYNPFTATWSVGTALPIVGDMGGSAIIGDTIYITNAVNRGASTCWPNLYKGYINPATPTTITWIAGPAHAQATSITGATAVGGKVYWFGGFIGLATPTSAGWVYDPATGLITSFTPVYPGTIARCQWIGARTLPGPNSGLYGFAGDSACNWSAPNRGYYRFPIPTQGGATHDVGCTRIIAPTGSYLSGTSVTPACSVYNYGNQTEASYNVKMTINTPVPTILNGGATAHAPGTAQYVTFPNWTADPVGGPYVVTCSTELTGDAVPANDKATGSVTVTAPPYADIGVISIVIPDTVEFCVFDTARVTVQNVGGAAASGGWWLRFDVLNPDQSHYLDSILVPDPLDPGMSHEYTFIWHPPTPSRHLITVTATFSDQNPANNTLTKLVVVKSKDLEVLPVSFHPAGPYTVGGYLMVDYSVHNKSQHLWNDTLYGVPVYLTITRPGGTVILQDTELIVAIPYCSTYVIWTDSFRLDTAGVWRFHVEAPVTGDNVPGDNTRNDSITVTPVGGPVVPGWTPMASVPGGPKGKNVKDGGVLAYNEENDTAQAWHDYIYALKGNGRYEFYKFNTAGNTWDTKESIPAIGSTGKKKPVKKGAVLIGDIAEGAPLGGLYGTKGNGTLDWWFYNPYATGGYPWSMKAGIPAGAKTVKEGAGACVVEFEHPEAETAIVYFIKGSGTNEFYKYDPVTDVWTTLANLPAGNGKPYKNGSAICYNDIEGGPNVIYLVKGSYNEFYSYNVDSNVWTTLPPVPFIGLSGKKKKVKEGAALACRGSRTVADNSVYVLKGGNTLEYWQYQVDSNRWTQLADMPLGGGKKVKGGGSMVFCESDGYMYFMKGNNTLEFYRYGFSNDYLAAVTPAVNAAGKGTNSITGYRLLVAPNPFSGMTTVSYSLPKAGNVSLKLYDVSGTLVTTLASGYHNAGTSSFILHPSSLSKGIYLLKYESDTYASTSKLIIE